MRHTNQLTPSVAFLHLAVDQPRRHLPLASMPSLAISLEPVSKMGGESIEIQIEAITGEDRQAARGQDLSERVDELVCHVLCAGTKLKHGKNLGAGINGQPEPQHLRMAAEPGAQFVQLQVRELEMAEGAFVQDLCMFPSASQPGDDGGLPVAKDPFGRRSVKSFGQRREDHGDLRRGSFQTVQGRMAASTEGGAASRASKGLDLLGTTMRAIPDQRVDVLCWLLGTSVQRKPP
jgi:hypothetical protein